MLSMINLIKDYKENKRKVYSYLRQLNREELYKLYIEVNNYEQNMLYKNLSNETIMTMITIILNRLIFNENVLNVAPELKYKGKIPKYNEKKVSEIAKQLDSEEKY